MLTSAWFSCRARPWAPRPTSSRRSARAAPAPLAPRSAPSPARTPAPPQHPPRRRRPARPPPLRLAGPRLPPRLPTPRRPRRRGRPLPPRRRCGARRPAPPRAPLPALLCRRLRRRPQAPRRPRLRRRRPAHRRLRHPATERVRPLSASAASPCLRGAPHLHVSSSVVWSSCGEGYTVRCTVHCSVDRVRRAGSSISRYVLSLSGAMAQPGSSARRRSTASAAARVCHSCKWHRQA